MANSIVAKMVKRAGNLAALAAALQASPQRISNWKVRGVPADMCPAIEGATGICCEELRPDLAWVRDADGRVTHYMVPAASERQAA